MTVLQDLPTELIREVFSLLSCVDLGPLCLVSRRFRSIAEPFLYKEVLLARPDKDELAITFFLRAVLDRPTLAGYVRFIDLNWLCPEDSSLDPDSTPETANDINLFDTVAKSLGLPESPWSHGAQIVLLLHVLPNLQEFDFLLPDSCVILDEFIEGTVDIPIASLPAGLQSLRKFRSDWTFDLPGLTPTMLHALLRLPSIREIDVHMESHMHRTEDPVEALISSVECRGMSSVTNLHLNNCKFKTSLLSGILQQPRALTHFSYHECNHRIAGFDITTFREALSHLRPTLQYLCLGSIQALEIRRGGNNNDGERYTIGSLRDWPVLRTVKCLLTTLLGRPAVATARLVDVVPAVIRELEITRIDDSLPAMYENARGWMLADMTDEIVDLLQRKEAYGLQGLAELTVHTSSPYAVAEVETVLSAACNASGVVGVRVDVD